MYSDRTGGEGTGRGLVCLHGLGGSRKVWEPLRADLARDHQVVCLDLPGHGGTRLRQPRVDLEVLADATAAALARLSLPEPVLVGHSLGGYIAALALRRHPGCARALVLVDQTFRLEPPLPEAVLAACSRDPEPLLQVMLGSKAVTPAQGRARVAEALAVGPEVLLGYLARLGEGDGADVAAGLTVPVLVCVRRAPEPGTRAFRAWMAAQALDRIPRVAVAVFPGAGHWIMLDRPRSLAGAIRDLEARLASPPQPGPPRRGSLRPW